MKTGEVTHDNIRTTCKEGMCVVNLASNMVTSRFFQRRHYKLMAELIRTLDVSPTDKLITAFHFTRYLKYTNINFDQSKFMKACGFISTGDVNQTEFDNIIVYHTPSGTNWHYVGNTR